MNKQKLVSIIVPVYNAEEYLDRLINSLISQTYKNIEIILLNDGSKDNSLQTLKKYQQEYPKLIKVYTHSNMGVGKTRNRGIEVCTGEYITFVDADDCIDSDFVSTLMNEIGENDIVVSGYKIIGKNNKIINRGLVENSEWSKFKQGSIWAKIYKKSFLIDNNIYFNSLKIAEDISFSIICYSNTNKIRCTSYVGYLYALNENSVMHNATEQRNNDIVKFLTIISNDISNNKKFINKNSRFIQYLYIKTIAAFYVIKAKYCTCDELQEYNDKCMEWYMKECKKNKWKFGFAYEKTEPFHINSAINLLILSEKLHLDKITHRLANKIFYQGQQ